jgi:hypothetical protein
MAELDPDALYHRTLDALPEGYTKLPPRAMWAAKMAAPRVNAYTIRKKKLVPVECYLKKDQDFKTYATRWELQHSRLALGSGSGKADPVVDESLTVVGHVGWYAPDSIFIPKKEMAVTETRMILVHEPSPSLWSRVTDGRPRHTATPTRVTQTRPLWLLLNEGVQVYVDNYERNYLKQDYGNLNEQHILYQLVTCPEGRAQFLASKRDMDALVESWVSPLDLISIGKLVALVGVAVAGKVLIRVLARRALVKTLQGAGTEIASGTAREISSGAAREEAGAATREATSVTLRGVGIAARAPFRRRIGRMSPAEMTQYLKELLGTRPDLRRLMAARVMTGQGRMDAIKIALKEFGDTQQGWKVVEKTAAEMEAVTSKNNLVTLRAEIREVWINNERANRWDPDKFYEHVVHDLSAHALAGRGGTLTADHLPFVGAEFRAGITDGLTLLERSIKEGNVDWIVKFFGR